MSVFPRSFLLRAASRTAAVLLAIACGGAAAAEIKVVFLAPDPPGKNPFWTQTVAGMETAAGQLGIDLEVAYSKSNTYSNRKDGMKLLSREDKPDYFLTGYYTGGTNALLEFADKRGIKTFVFNSGVPVNDPDNVGSPRGKYRRWIGQMTPDDVHAGERLADRLLGAARAAAGADKTIHVIGVGGLMNISSNDTRQQGLNRSIKTDAKAVLDRYLYAEWSESVAYNLLLDELGPDSPVSVLWCSGDTMAVGAIRAARQRGKTPGKDIFVGSIDGLRQGLEAVAAGEMEVTLGGHVLEGAWALVLLHDYHHGHDFAEDLGTQFQTRYIAITADNVQDYLSLIANTDWNDMDFRRFSKVHNPELKTYRWPLDEVLAQLRTRKAGD